MLRSIPYIEGLAQRGYADLIEAEVAASFQRKYPEKFHAARSKRSVEDFSLRDETGDHWYDVKSFDENADFSMPNLVSIERLAKILKDPNQTLTYVVVHYSVDHDKKLVDLTDYRMYNIEYIDHSCLAIQNLGLGVLQLKNSKNPILVYEGDDWSKDFTKMCKEFYAKQVRKFTKLMEQYN
jgi:hypothetical protein